MRASLGESERLKASLVELERVLASLGEYERVLASIYMCLKYGKQCQVCIGLCLPLTRLYWTR